jgi:transcriptional regulator of acetoin/glycerol metabolism
MPQPSALPGPRTAALPTHAFFGSGPQRVRLARERYFDNGQRPTGLVGEPVIQSWARCMVAHRRPGEAISFEPVSRSRIQATLARNRHLLGAAGDELARLETALGDTGCRVLLTDAEGVVVHATQASGGSGMLLPTVSRVGVSLAELCVGTNAPAVVIKSGQACTVLGAEHFFDSVQALHCAAAPIRDGRGALAGVLDLTVEARPFGFDAAALVGIYATAIENRLLQADADEHLVLQFQVAHSLLGSPLEALVGVASDGSVAWANGTAQQLLGLVQGGAMPDAESVFGARLSTLQAALAHDQAQAHRLPNGLTVWLRARRSAHDGVARVLGRGADFAPAPALESTVPPQLAALPALHNDRAPAANRVDSVETAVEVAQAAAAQAPAAIETRPAPTLGQHTRELIDKALADCNGNISQAARLLGVSRGLLYRRRRDSEAAAAAGGGD